MSVKNMMRTNFVVCTEDMTLEKVFEEMVASDAEHAVVVEGLAHSIPIGVITERDICAQIIGRSRNPRGLTAANVMNTTITKIKADAAFTELSTATLPKVVCVVNENGGLCGTIAARQLDSQVPRSAETTTSPSMVRHFQVSMANRLY
jgi:CBS domain-containing protein